jgi:L-asparaginase II
MSMDPTVSLVRVRRGGHVESLHRGLVAVWQGARLKAVLGDPQALTFYRSSSKPLQALAAVTLGAADAYGLTAAELALACGSHSGAPVHVAAARSILTKAQVPEALLGCGGHWSIDADVAHQQRTAASLPAAVLSNCSGKHALMLAGAQRLGATLHDYLAPTHPLQRQIRADVARFAGLAPEQAAVTIDGCGAPTFAVPLAAMACSIARLAAPFDVPEPLARAATRLVEAMSAHPEMVAGEGRFDTELMRAGAGAFVAKGGAEGVHVVAVPRLALGLVVKVEDGSDRGYRLVVVEVLRRLGLLTEAQASILAEKQGHKTQKNFAGRTIGELEVLLPAAFP